MEEKRQRKLENERKGEVVQQVCVWGVNVHVLGSFKVNRLLRGLGCGLWNLATPTTTSK